MRGIALALLSCGFLAACGVKAPPIAPERTGSPALLKLDCSPQDPTCDQIDPDYQPQRKPSRR